MTTLAEWQSFARSTNLRGWTRLKKNELKDFLIKNLWGKGLDQPQKKARKRRNPLMTKNKKINVPFLIPERRIIPPRAIPRAIEQNVDNVVDWSNWLESVNDVDVRRRSNPAVEKLKKQIAELWGKRLIVEKGKSALKGFAKQFWIQGDDSISPQDFFRKARWHIVALLQQNPQTKVKCTLNVEMSRINWTSGEEIIADPFFHSRQKKNLGNNAEIIDEMEQEMISNMENFNRRGSNWMFKKSNSFGDSFCALEPVKRIFVDSFACEIGKQKSFDQHEKPKTKCVSNGVWPEQKTR